jgi:hypothetical protein
MLFHNKLTQTLSFGASASTLALHPTLPVLANDQGHHLLISNFRINNTQQLNVHREILQMQFTRQHLISLSRAS